MPDTHTHTYTHSQFNGKCNLKNVFLLCLAFVTQWAFQFFFFSSGWCSAYTHSHTQYIFLMKPIFSMDLCKSSLWIQNYFRLRKFLTEKRPTNFAYTKMCTCNVYGLFIGVYSTKRIQKNLLHADHRDSLFYGF